MDRARHRRPLGGRSQAGHVRRPRVARRRAAVGPPALSYGRGVPRGPGRGNRARDGSLRLRGCHPERPARERVDLGRPGEHPGGPSPHRRGAPRPRVRLRDLRPVLEGIPPPPLRGGGDAGPPPGVAPQRPLPPPPRRGGAQGDPGGNLRTLEPGMAPALPRWNRGMNALLLTLMAPTDGSNPVPVLLFQFGAIILIFYFLLIRPQSQARKKHSEILSQLKKGDEITTSARSVAVAVKVTMAPSGLAAASRPAGADRVGALWSVTVTWKVDVAVF